jgi:naphthoate synthase/2-ketocyclohexanecarboxyl-CoA hydrolase
MYPHWFDMPEGKEGGRAFLDKRRAKFWSLRENEEKQRRKIADAYVAALPERGSPQASGDAAKAPKKSKK